MTATLTPAGTDEALREIEGRMLPEDPGERLDFDRAARLHGGAMQAVAAALTMAHRMDTGGGSWGKMLAIYANECARAATLRSDNDRLTKDLAAAQDLAYQLKLAAAGGEDVPGSANAVTVEDVNRWRQEASEREEILSSDLAAAREALKPFAKIADDARVMTNYGTDITHAPDGWIACGLEIPVDHLRAARTALTPGGDHADTK